LTRARASSPKGPKVSTANGTNRYRLRAPWYFLNGHSLMPLNSIELSPVQFSSQILSSPVPVM
jgi:hypothetical protein